MSRRILVVDDEVGFTRLLKLNLEQDGDFNVRVVNWAEDALPAAIEFKPELMVLDVLMPRMFGGDVVGQFRSHPGLRSLPIIFLSGTVERERVAEHDGVISGHPFLAKPATFEEIRAFIEEHLPPAGPP
jgi:CheY-like chemotaxis protein